MKQHAVVLFDGNCTFCNKSVRFIINHDPKAYFTFAALDGEVGKSLKEQYNIPGTVDSLVLIENNNWFAASSAALRICRNLTGIYTVAALFLLIPKPLRDAVYQSVAKRRHHMFTKHPCPLPTPEQQKRFLD